MVSTFEALVLGLLFFGAIVPIWGLLGVLYVTERRRGRFLETARRGEDSITRLDAYTRIIHSILDEIKNTENRAPVLIACVRELSSFPEYRDLTVLLLDEISVTGSTHFDQLMKQEMTRLETSLLESKHE